jgi:hypothetical protein
MSKKHDQMMERISKHGEDLKKFFCLPADVDPIKLCKSLFRLENKAHRLAEDLCNWRQLDETVEKEVSAILEKACKILACNENEIFVNLDPRGYALKIHSEFARYFPYRDWGGYGIIAPDFREVE